VPRCFLCGSKEDDEHLLFKCPVAEFMWSFVKEALIRMEWLS
jgi:hypothetical protein